MSRRDATTWTLTERYLREVTRRVPADQRSAVWRAVHGAIVESSEARDPSGSGSAERRALAQLGDPARVAARYAGRRPVLVGPDLHPLYRRTLTGLLAVVLPVLTAAVVAVDVLDGADLGSVVVTGLATAATVAAHAIAWTTVVFAVVERRRGSEPPSAAADPWTPDCLPEPGVRRPRAGWISAAWHAALLGAVVWQHAAKPYRADGGGAGDGLEVLDPVLWSGWIWPVLGGLAGIVVVQVVQSAAGRWSAGLLGWYAVAHAVFALPLAWILAQHRLVNPDVLTDFNGGWSTPDAFYTVTALGVLAASVLAVVDRVREVRS